MKKGYTDTRRKDRLGEIRQFLLKSSLSIEDMEKVGKIYE